MLEFFSDCNIDLFLGQLNHAAVPGAAHFLQLKRLFQTVNFFGLIESFVCRGGGLLIFRQLQRLLNAAANPDIRDLPVAELIALNNLINTQLARHELTHNLQAVFIRITCACLYKTFRKITRRLLYAATACLHLTFFLFVRCQLFSG